jgi:hypothetical protein
MPCTYTVQARSNKPLAEQPIAIMSANGAYKLNAHHKGALLGFSDYHESLKALVQTRFARVARVLH